MSNKLIAEFMGGYTPYERFGDSTEYYYRGDYVTLENMKFQTSWDWLMPVINKIRSMDSTYEVEEVGKYDWDNEISHYEFDLELTYESVVEFIKQLNNNEDENN